VNERVGRRAAYQRSQRRRAILIAATSTTIAIVALVVLVPLTPGWDNVRQAFFDGDVFVDSFPRLLRAFWLDVKILLWSTPLILVVSLVVALARSARSPALFPVKALAIVYTDVFRGIPTILCVYLVGFGVPALELSGLPTDPVVLGGAALALSYSAYVAEVYRSGIHSIHPGQR
jgi:polar amino acid transport system permease protein